MEHPAHRGKPNFFDLRTLTETTPPLSVPFYFYAKLINALKDLKIIRGLPLYEYSLWIAKREFSFFRHVAFDQLVTPQTTYIDKKTIERWLSGYPCIDKESVYIIMRNGNSWKFGGIKKTTEVADDLETELR